MGRNKLTPWASSKRERESTIHVYRVDRGLTVRQLSDLSGVPMGVINDLATGTCSPLHERSTKFGNRGQLKKSATLLASALNVDVGDLFPRYVCNIQPRSDSLVDEQLADLSTSEFTLNESEPYSDHYERKELLVRALELLKKRDRMILLAYYGVGLTINEAAEKWGLCGMRIRQILARAVRLTRWRIQTMTKERSHEAGTGDS